MSSNTIVSFIPVEPENRARIRAIAPDLEFVCLYLESAPIMTREKPDVDVFVFDELGREVKDYPYLVKDTEKGRIFTLELKPDHCAAIVKK